MILDPDADETMLEDELAEGADGGEGMILVEIDGQQVRMSAEQVAEIEEQMRRANEERMARLDALAQSLARTRAEAINARMSSGIEDIWTEDEEFYSGIDDANRGEEKSLTWRTKPMGQPKTPNSDDKKPRSTVFPNITGPYTDAAAARVADMLLPTDDRGWSIGPTPVPELGDLAHGKISPAMEAEARSLYPGNPDMAKSKLAEAVASAAQIMAEAKKKADRAQERIDDWHVECQFQSHVRQVIEDSARIGVGILKGPVPISKRRVTWKDGAIAFDGKIAPGSRRIDAWNFYPDPACGEDIHNGSYTWERDTLTRRQVRDLRGQEGYIDSQLSAVLEEGPRLVTNEYKRELDPVADQTQNGKFEVWYFYGTVEKMDLEAAGCDCEDMDDPHIPVMITMINNRVIRASVNPLDTGEFPYDVFVWRKRTGHWTGIGVPRQIRTPQRMVTAATRNLMDNAGLAAGPMLVFRQNIVSPANGRLEIAPRKLWWIDEDAEEMNDATKAIGVIKVDMLVQEMQEIIMLGLRFAEDVTGMPMILQGQMGQKAPDTLGGMQMLQNNASGTLRRLAKLFDDRITEPHVRRYYLWLLQYGDDAEKGDYCIDARGSSALLERDLQNQMIAQMGQLVLDPRFGKDPKKWMDEYLRSQRLDPAKFDYEDEQWQKIVENMANGPQDPRLAVAELKAKVDQQILQMEQAFEAQERAKDRELELLLTGIESELETRKQQGAEVISLQDVKAMLAAKTIDARTKRANFLDEKRLKLSEGSGI